MVREVNNKSKVFCFRAKGKKTIRHRLVDILEKILDLLSGDQKEWFRRRKPFGPKIIPEKDQ